MKKNFIRSQVDRLKGGDFVVEDPPGHFHREYMGGKPPNAPINLEYAKTYYASVDDNHRWYSIVFIMARHHDNDEKFIAWYYPHTEEGKACRDADLAFINDLTSIKCPQTNTV